MTIERFNPEMVVLARTYREMTQKDLAQAMATTQGRVSRLEHGLSGEPGTDLVDALARALRFPRTFFYQPGHIYALPARHHRRRKQIARGTMDRIHAEITLRASHIAKLLRATDLHSDFEVPEIDLDDMGGTPEDVARHIRERWAVPRGPISNLVALMESAGVLVVPCAFGVSEMDAVGMRVPGLPPLMFVNDTMPVDRLRFTLAHELAHLVMHSLPREDMEGEADRFASEFLMPEADIRPQLRNATIQTFALLKKVWRVSMAALLKRAQQLRTISARAATSMWKVFAANGWRRREPPELDLSPENPTVLRALIQFHESELNYTPDAIGRVLDLHPPEFRQFYPMPGLRLVG